jgi:hypothetical protein
MKTVGQDMDVGLIPGDEFSVGFAYFFFGGFAIHATPHVGALGRPAPRLDPILVSSASP